MIGHTCDVYGKNRRYFKTLATAVNTCRRVEDWVIFRICLCAYTLGVDYRRYYTPWFTRTHTHVHIHTSSCAVCYLFRISLVSKPTIYFYSSSITIYRHQNAIGNIVNTIILHILYVCVLLYYIVYIIIITHVYCRY